MAGAGAEGTGTAGTEGAVVGAAPAGAIGDVPDGTVGPGADEGEAGKTGIWPGTVGPPGWPAAGMIELP